MRSEGAPAGGLGGLARGIGELQLEQRAPMERSPAPASAGAGCQPLHLQTRHQPHIHADPRAAGPIKMPHHPSVSPYQPQGRQWGEGLEDGLKAANAALEEGCQASEGRARAVGGLFFSAGVGWLAASHMPDETAQ